MNAHTITPETFDAQKKTLIAVLLTVLTAGFYIQFWFINLYLRLNNIKQDDLTRYAIPFIPICIQGWNTFIVSTFWMTETLTIVSGILSVLGFIIMIYLSFLVTEKLEQAFVGDGYAVKMSKVWTFFLPAFYQYYIITNIVDISNKNIALQDVIRRQGEASHTVAPETKIPDTAAKAPENETAA